MYSWKRYDKKSIETHPKITSNPGRFYPYFEDCIGALDDTHIPAFVPENIANRFRGRKSYATQNVLAAVDFDLRFTYVLAGWEGSAHDSVVLRAALNRSNGIPMPEGKYDLADVGYARPGILPPYRGVRYHLKEYGGGRCPETPQELFNLRHSSLCTSVERALGTLKNRFKILASQVSSSSIGAMKPNKKSFKRVGKSKTLPAATKLDRANKSKASSSLDDNDVDVVLTNTLLGINKNLEKPVQVAPPPDPNKPLWDMLKNIQLLPDDRMAVGMYLCKPELQVHRSFLISMGEEYLSRWVYKFYQTMILREISDLLMCATTIGRILIVV